MSRPEKVKSRTLTCDELRSEMRERFGDNPLLWAFQCPRCGDVANAQDFRDAGANPNRVGQECIGRHRGALSGKATRDSGRKQATRGCDWAAYGLFPGPWFVVMPDQREVPSFPIAPELA